MGARLETELRALLAEAVGPAADAAGSAWAPRLLAARARLARRLSRAYGRPVAPDDVTIRPRADGRLAVSLPCSPSAVADLRARWLVPAGGERPARDGRLP